MAANPNRDSPIPVSILYPAGALAFPLAAAFIALQVIIPSFYAETTGLSLTAVGVVMLLARLADSFTDPVVGMLSDRTPERLGKRRVWILLATPLMCVSTWYLFNPPGNASQTYLLLWATALYAAGTMIVVPLTAWGAELSPQYHQRSRITSVRALFGLLGTLTALGLPVLFVPNATNTLAGSLGLITQLVFVSSFVAVVWVLWMVPDTASITLPRATLKPLWSLLSRPSPFRQLLTSFLLNSIANAIPATLFLFYLEHIIQSPQSAGKLLFAYFFCSAISIPFWLLLSKRFGKHQTWSVAMAIACLFFFWTPFLNGTDLYWYAAIVVLTGFMIGADLVLPSAVMGDLIEWDALENGYRRPGLFFALWSTTTKLAFALAVGVAFPLLELIGFDARAGTDPAAIATNSPQALQGLALLYGLPCITFKVLAILNMRDYPLTEQQHHLIREELERRETR